MNRRAALQSRTYDFYEMEREPPTPKKKSTGGEVHCKLLSDVWRIGKMKGSPKSLVSRTRLTSEEEKVDARSSKRKRRRIARNT